MKSREVSRAGLGLQPLLHGGKPRRGAVEKAMRVLNDIAMHMRRQEIFDAGAQAKSLKNRRIRYDGHELGSSERCTFYDGFASTHPEFKNPYRRIGR